MSEVIKVDNLFFKYDSEYVLRDINFSIEKGDFLGLAGPNGGGKTTLIKLILGLLKPTQGKVSLFGKDSTLFREKSKLGYMPQKINNFNSNFPATVKEVVSMGILAEKHFPRYISHRDEHKVYNAMKMTNITDLQTKLIGDLSGGQMQRVYMARIFTNTPEILFLDEPTSALDLNSRQKFMDLLVKLNKEKKTTIIFITHDNSQIGKYANKMLFLDREMVFFGGLGDFCKSQEMEKYFGHFAQHMICHRHDKDAVNVK
ncbi:MAG TPA: metal ABC transporter ATP-binding protein [Elusimicrobiales bacterium]|nr:metal ABC transporter ATP-binding protein [Elusimicrobiales bacterium]